jgi:hypothetical protein
MNPFLRIQRLWVYGGALSALILLALAPLLADVWRPELVAVYLILPIYMLHQFEEHDNNRFAQFISKHVGNGREVLSLGQIFWINIGLVWTVVTVDIWLADKVAIGWGLIAIYLTLLNAFAHIAQGLFLRIYNPGLFTAGFVFLPYCIWAADFLHQSGEVTPLQDGIAILLAIAGHAVILLMAYRNLQRRP